MDLSDEEVSQDQLKSTSNASTEEDVQSINLSSRVHSVSRPDSQDQDRSHVGRGVEEHRNMMLASLLEDYYRNRAIEFLNTTSHGDGEIFTRHSPEVQSLARELFARATRTLSSNGLLSSVAASDRSQNTRRQYLLGFDSLVRTTQTTASNILDPIHDLVVQSSQLSLLPNPANDLQLMLPPLPPPRSHYQSSFREISLLGKGGFGKVYQCYNVLDQKTYAVKKIPLSPKLGKNFSDGKHDELQHILREVKALAMLEHPNIVRYHATWFEEPQRLSHTTEERDQGTGIKPRLHQQLLLDSQPFQQSTEDDFEAEVEVDQSISCGVVFGEDTPSSPNAQNNEVNQEPMPSGRGWSEQSATGSNFDDEETSISDSNIFTDGRSTRQDNTGSQGRTRPSSDTRVPVLYIQMSMYPTTLAHYISPPSHSHQTTAVATGTPKHCFHIVPTLRLLNSIHSGLQYIHAQGLIHRDIKPGNIFLSAPSLEAAHQGGYCDLSCQTCTSLADKNKHEKDDDSAELAPPPPPRWLNPRIGDFGLVAQLAHGEVPSSASAESSSISSSRAALRNVGTDANALIDIHPKPPAHAHKPVGTAFYQPPPHPNNHGSNDKNEKIDTFALGVVLVEMLCRCSTAMERADMLRGCQEGRVPANVAENLGREGYDADIAEGVLSLVRGMINPDPEARWSGARVRDAIRGLLRKCEEVRE
ncbi:kinase-like domain-containing protein [Biscogniauxia marginata]|nr:kinase-like domain-containing protein [Biscogniauxia marginata]